MNNGNYSPPNFWPNSWPNTASDFEKTRILKIKFGPIFFGSNPVFKGVVSNFLMVVKVVILCFFFRYQMHKPSTHNSKSIFIFQRLCFQM